MERGGEKYLVQELGAIIQGHGVLCIGDKLAFRLIHYLVNINLCPPISFAYKICRFTNGHVFSLDEWIYWKI